jgi:hypothetical protein
MKKRKGDEERGGRGKDRGRTNVASIWTEGGNFFSSTRKNTAPIMSLVLCAHCETEVLEEYQEGDDVAGYICPRHPAFEPGQGCHQVVRWDFEFEMLVTLLVTPS